MSNKGGGLPLEGFCGPWIVLLLIFALIGLVGGILTVTGNISHSIRENNVNAINARLATGTRYLSTKAQSSGVVNVSSEGGFLLTQQGSLTFNDVEVPDEGDYYFAVIMIVSGSGGHTIDVTVNGQFIQKLITNPGEDCTNHCIRDLPFSQYIQIHLKAGSNTILLSNETPADAYTQTHIVGIIVTA